VQQTTGTLLQGGVILGPDAEIILVIDPTAEPSPWYGSFVLPVGTKLSKPGPYQLELADGRHGDVTVTRVRLLECALVGTFTGDGPLREPSPTPRGGARGSDAR
jgi:hypothetical protein